ncbi:MAG: hypothetical protein QM270_08870 [Bacillota bacterium]|nr:hypothetical protein [Bacillota bacterium]
MKPLKQQRFRGFICLKHGSRAQFDNIYDGSMMDTGIRSSFVFGDGNPAAILSSRTAALMRNRRL